MADDIASLMFAASQKLTDQQFPDLKQMATLAALNQRTELERQKAAELTQNRNTLRSTFSDPASLDERGYPTVNALRTLAQGAPAAYADILPMVAKGQHNQAIEAAQNSKLASSFKDAKAQLYKSALAQYDLDLKDKGPEVAGQTLQGALVGGLNEMGTTGQYPRAWIDAMRSAPPPDPETLRREVLGYDAARVKPATAHELATERHQKVTEGQGAERLRLDQGAQARLAVGSPDNYDVTYSDGRKETILGSWDSANRVMIRADGTSEPLPQDAQIVKAARAGEHRTLAPSKPIAVVDKEGNVVARMSARETTTGEPGWFDTDTGKRIVPPEGGRIDTGPNESPIMGSKESTYQNRVLNSALDATLRLKGLSMMPTTVSTGAFGLGTSNVGLLDAPRAMLAQGLSSGEVQRFNALMAGVNRSMATIEAAGLAPGQKFSDQFGALALKPTDKLETKLFKLGEMRQVVENGMEVILNNSRVGPSERKLAEKIQNTVKEQIPWTIFDVIELQNSKNPKQTLKQLGVKETGKGGEAPARAKIVQAGPDGDYEFDASKDPNNDKEWKDPKNWKKAQ